MDIQMILETKIKINYLIYELSLKVIIVLMFICL